MSVSRLPRRASAASAWCPAVGRARQAGEASRGILTSVGEQAEQNLQAVAGAAAAATHSAEAAADAGRELLKTLVEQGRHNVQAGAALAGAVSWNDAFEVQREFVAGSVARMSRAGECYLRMLRVGPATARFAAGQ